MGTSYIQNNQQTRTYGSCICREHLQVISEPSWPKFMQPLRYVKVLSTFPDAQAVPVRYVAKLDPPLPASDAIIRKIMTITSLAGEGTVDAVYAFLIRYNSWNYIDLLNAVNIDNTPLSPAPSLEKLLVWILKFDAENVYRTNLEMIIGEKFRQRHRLATKGVMGYSKQYLKAVSQHDIF